ncbi:MAG TPA: NAD(P)/FAD-dependent oxidoreductase [Candidatus Methylomirabilis sp.]|nr:NAD(P)/FAD-dependent oxidoreductase [Candidatus Methylomirabilis sp.]
MRSHEVSIVGSGPNGLAAAITLARAGLAVSVYEANDTVGGGARSAELTLPGFVHDVCSAVHPLALASPFFRTVPLADHGMAWIHPPAALAHPLDDGTAIMLERSIDATARGLESDAAAYRRLMGPFADEWDALEASILGPPLRLPRHPLALARFAAYALLPARWLAERLFRQDRARALFAGVAAHSLLSLEQPLSASFGLVLAVLAHVVGWPIARRGSQRIADALADYLRSLGGTIITGRRVESIHQLSAARAVLFEVTPRQLLRIAGNRLPAFYRSRLARYRYGPGVFKLDYALDGPIPWKAAECLRAATVHLGGDLAEIAASERAVNQGEIAEHPFVLVTQPSLFDATRAPKGKHTAWAYCHVPSGSSVDMTARIEAQIERFATGFRSRILARHALSPAALEEHNPNCIGGDISGGVHDFRQLFARPALRLDPYSTPARGLYLCSASTPPGGGVHGMCGYHAACSALRQLSSR